MNKLERLEIVGKIGRKLQEEKTFTDIKSYFNAHEIDHASKKTSGENSKWIFTREVLADEPDSKIEKIAYELGLALAPLSNSQDNLATNINKENKPSIFISHAAKDKALADAFCDLLETGIGIKSQEIFCSSQPGLGILAGNHFVNYIKNQLSNSKHIVMLVSPNFMESKFCQNELGGTWALEKTYTPFVVKPTLRGEVKDVLTGVQLLQILESYDLDEFETDIKKKLNIVGKDTVQWNKKKAQFLEQANIIINELPAPETINFQKHQNILKELEAYKIEVSNNQKSLSKKDELISLLKNEKPGINRSDAYIKSLPISSHFTALTKLIKEKMKQLPHAVRETIYYHEQGARFYPPKDYDWDSIKNAQDRKMLKDNDSEVSLNENSLPIQDLLSDIKKLSKLLSNSEGLENFVEEFAKAHKYYLEMDNKDFWKEYLGL